MESFTIRKDAKVIPKKLRKFLYKIILESYETGTSKRYNFTVKYKEKTIEYSYCVTPLFTLFTHLLDFEFNYSIGRVHKIFPEFTENPMILHALASKNRIRLIKVLKEALEKLESK